MDGEWTMLHMTIFFRTMITIAVVTVIVIIADVLFMVVDTG